MEEIYNGAFDNRPIEKQQKDWYQEELVAQTNPVNWVVKKRNEFRSFPVMNQNYTNKCVAFTLRKLAMINYFLKTGELLDFSASFPYEYRVNKPTGGMIGVDAFDIWVNRGIPTEALCRSNQIRDNDEVKIDEMAIQVAKGFLCGAHIGINPGDFDRVASTIQTTDKGIMGWFYFTSREWSKEFPEVMDNLTSPYDERASRHSVTIVDFGILDGKEVLKVEDSAHFGGLNTRYITREFFEKRNFFNRYSMNFKYEQKQEETPKLTKTLRMGMTDPEVVILQNILKNKGYYATNSQSTGFFGSYTHSVVVKLQKDFGLVVDGIVGPKTREVLNK